MVSCDQLSSLIDYMEAHPDLALGRCSRSKEGRSLSKRLWTECAEMLNSVSSNCLKKTPELWRVYYNDYKSKLLKKIKVEKGEICATGGGPARNITMTPLQERLYEILGRDVGEPLPGVRHNPISDHEDERSNIYQADPNTSQNLNDPSNLEVIELPPEGIINDDHQSSIRPDHFEILAEITNIVNYEENDEGAGQQQTDNNPNRQAESTRQSRPPRQRRRRRPASPPHDVLMREASDRLENLEKINAEATREHAQATHRLAAAIEALGERMREPIVFILQNPSNLSPPRSRRRYNRITTSSEESN